MLGSGPGDAAGAAVAGRTRRRRGCGRPDREGSAAAGPSGGGGARGRPGRVLTKGAARARGVRTRETRWSAALRRARGLAGKRGETGRRRRCHRSCHRAINTGSAHTRRRLRRGPSAKSAGRGPGSGSARATAPRRLRRLQLCGSFRSWRHGLLPPPPSRSLLSGPRRGPTPARGSCAAAELPGPGPPLQSRWRRRRAGTDFGTRRGRGWRPGTAGLQPSLSTAAPSSRGESADFL